MVKVSKLVFFSINELVLKQTFAFFRLFFGIKVVRNERVMMREILLTDLSKVLVYSMSREKV